MIGAGGHAKVVVATALAAGREVAAVLDDAPALFGTALGGARVEGPVASALAGYGDCEAVVAVGDNAARARLASLVRLPFATLVHPFSWIAPDASLGEGTVVFAGAVVQPGTRIGRHAILNTGCSVDHDGDVGDFAHVAPGARLAGAVTLGAGAFVGIGASVVQGRAVGAWATVGAGAAVVRDVDAGATVRGVPAR